MNKLLIVNPQTVADIKNKVDEIANCMIDSTQTSLSLMSGKVGEILFWAYYSKYIKDGKYDEKIVQMLSQVFDEVHKGFKYPTFAGGLAGIGWTVEHLAQNDFINTDTNKSIGSLDDFLYSYMLRYIREGNYDYLHGAIGIGLYYLSRSSNTRTRMYLEELVEEIEKQNTKIDNGIAWKTTLDIKSSLRGYNLSLSHGSASIVIFLSRLYESGILVDKISDLVTGAVNFLLQNKRDKVKFRYQYPGWICEADKNQDGEAGGRLAWCYNDLGISIALWQAGQIFNNESWKKEAVNNLLYLTEIKDLKVSGVFDTGLCHGAAGVAHIFSKMYNYTSIDTFKNSSQFWFEQSLKMASFEDGLAGYKSFRTPEYGGLKNDYSFLTGISGIGLAMISAVSDIEPKSLFKNISPS